MKTLPKPLLSLKLALTGSTKPIPSVVYRAIPKKDKNPEKLTCPNLEDKSTSVSMINFKLYPVTENKEIITTNVDTIEIQPKGFKLSIKLIKRESKNAKAKNFLLE